MSTDFAKRLTQACDESPTVPEHGRGRQVYLAKVLGVDHVWLSMGVSPMEIAEKRQAALRGDAAVYGVMSYLLLAGYHVAIPPTYKLGKRVVADRAVVEAFFASRRAEGMKAITRRA